jgi:hypothetical protein
LLESVTGYSPSLPNAGDQRLAALGDPHRPFLSRVRCIASFGLFCNKIGADPTCSVSAALPAIPG